MEINNVTIGIGLVLILALSFIGSQILVRIIGKATKESAEGILQQAREQAKNIELEARDAAIKIKQESEADISRRRVELSNEDDRLQNRRVDLDHRF